MKYLLIIITLLLLSCSKENAIFEYTYYSKSEQIKTEKHWTNQAAYNNGDYYIKTYNKNGNLKSIVNFRKNIQHGYTKRFYPNGQIENQIHYHNGILDGISQFFNKKGTLISEFFYLNGVDIVTKRFTIDSEGHSYYNVFSKSMDSSTYRIEGYYDPISEGKYSNLSCYYQTNLKDSIKLSDSTLFKVFLYLSEVDSTSKIVSQLTLGHLDANLGITDTLSFFKSPNNQNIIDGYYIPQSLGHINITGQVFSKEYKTNGDDYYYSFIFYKSVYVYE